MFDTKSLVPEHLRHGNTKTFTGFTTPTADNTEIDYIFVKDPKDMEFLSYGVLPNRFDDDPVFISDHRPVVVDVRLRVDTNLARK